MHLMTTSVLPFEVAGLLLLVALIGAAYIAGKRE
jgi:NADH:ubiquinone oxidoreductase subunit 6 (subunit J)